MVLRRELSKIQLRLLSFKISSKRKLISDLVSKLGNVRSGADRGLLLFLSTIFSFGLCPWFTFVLRQGFFICRKIFGTNRGLLPFRGKALLSITSE